MQTLTQFGTSILIISASSTAFACPSKDPKGFTVLEKSEKGTLFTNAEKNQVLAIKCTKMSGEEAKRTATLFPAATTLNSEIQKVALASSGDASTTLYLRATDNELIQLTVTAKSNDTKKLEEIQKFAVDYISKN